MTASTVVSSTTSSLSESSSTPARSSSPSNWGPTTNRTSGSISSSTSLSSVSASMRVSNTVTSSSGPVRPSASNTVSLSTGSSPLTSTRPSGSASLIVQRLTEPNGPIVTVTLPTSASVTGLETLTISGSTLTVKPISITSSVSSTPSASTSNVETFTEPDGSSVVLTLPPGCPASRSSITIADSCPDPSGPTPANDAPPESPEPTNSQTSSLLSSSSSSSSPSACSATLSVPVPPSQLTAPTVTLNPALRHSLRQHVALFDNLIIFTSATKAHILNYSGHHDSRADFHRVRKLLCLDVDNHALRDSARAVHNVRCLQQLGCDSDIDIDRTTYSNRASLYRHFYRFGLWQVLEQTQLNAIGQCYSPTDSSGNPISFECFSITYISTAVSDSASLSAFKEAGCSSRDDSQVMDYANLTAIDYDNETPFTMKSLSLYGA
ncbi:uncharacterized protein TRUGW13939_11528 [Talaromyces rugulosus]|uniref:Uncharacterized protein n=1 Tax=Talaromyces rugulosus TaxID=121627 RepID=A0A7H8RD54_TALRU|nr:uncharacterized protein TRUGW13939_11528 [Talaromyces rugulosus]QKX64354.1 hypothetical protein TRUGW13939_11528 [Talaromyces rugulosus]